jgi:RNA polymerase sigma-70 factor (ECF subfamily)
MRLSFDNIICILNLPLDAMNHAWESAAVNVATKIACRDSANTEPIVLVPTAVVMGCNERDDPGRMLAGCRQYLLMIANEVIGPELQAKFGASDLVQETFLEAQRHLANFRGQSPGEMRAWLRKILECRLANIRRSYLATEMRAANREVTLDPCAAESGAGIASLKSRVPSPSNHAVRNEWNAALQRALTRLPEHYRQAVASRHIEQLSWDEIGRRMNCTADAARKVWSRAIQQLRRELAEHESMS